jgi:hypothetical protein
MNAFEKFDADRAKRRQNLVLAWSQFRAATCASVASFNRMEEGVANPAKLDESPDGDLLTVNCKRQSMSGSGLLSVVAKMTLNEKRQVAILARVEFWSLETDPASSQGAEEFEFVAESEPEACLSHEGNRITAGEAADIVLMRALLGLPVRSNVASVNKRPHVAA